MAHDIIFLLLGLVLIVVGGNFVTDGAVTIARRFNVSSLVIGLTVVAFGSSAPDLVVCLTSTLADKSQLALGDVVGANIMDILFVAGLVAVIRPITVSNAMVAKDLPMLALSSFVLFACGDDLLFDGTSDYISRTDGLMLLGFFIIYMYYTIAMAHDSDITPPPSATQTAPTQAQAATITVTRRDCLIAVAKLAAGLGALIVGGNWIVDGASGIALKAGLSEGLVGLTIVAFGSAAPDLATSLSAAIKNQPSIALGNLVGSCIFNVYFVLGVCAVSRPLDTGSIRLVDFAALFGGSLLLWLFGRIIGHNIIRRGEGVVLIVCYGAYLAYLIAQL